MDARFWRTGGGRCGRPTCSPVVLAALVDPGRYTYSGDLDADDVEAEMVDREAMK